MCVKSHLHFLICLLLCPFLRARVRNIDDDGVTPNQLALPYN